ncbi:hypothetical protein BJ165DRAFT_1515652 [Panaeolus papilionaceus]|nr:hypothetical protein BJ165DRAFT_1515652 [Panaeolus papilionaceus]
MGWYWFIVGVGDYGTPSQLLYYVPILSFSLLWFYFGPLFCYLYYLAVMLPFSSRYTFSLTSLLHFY